jgi:hypothetical protein
MSAKNPGLLWQRSTNLSFKFVSPSAKRLVFSFWSISQGSSPERLDLAAITGRNGGPSAYPLDPGDNIFPYFLKLFRTGTPLAQAED